MKNKTNNENEIQINLDNTIGSVKKDDYIEKKIITEIPNINDEILLQNKKTENLNTSASKVKLKQKSDKKNFTLDNFFNKGILSNKNVNNTNNIINSNDSNIQVDEKEK